MNKQKPKVQVYYLPGCKWCHKAFNLLKQRHIAYQAINVSSTANRNEMLRRTARTSVPQIFYGNYHIGGYDDLSRLFNQLDGRARKVKR